MAPEPRHPTRSPRRGARASPGVGDLYLVAGNDQRHPIACYNFCHKTQNKLCTVIKVIQEAHKYTEIPLTKRSTC
eukprot:6212086-Pleurochrysis_carterae.AAC.2